MTRSEFTLRLSVILAAPLAALFSAPMVVVAILGCASLANTGQMVARAMPKAEPIAAMLIAAVTVIVTLILLGLVLDLTPGGLGFTNWQLGWAAISLATLFVVRDELDLHESMDIGLSMPVVLSISIIAVASFGAFAIGNAGVDKQNDAPLLEMSSAHHSLVEAKVLVRSVNSGGQFTLEAFGDGNPHAGAAPLPVTLPRSGTALRNLTVLLPPARHYWKLQLLNKQTGLVERELILSN
jgi:hypothetical protein